MKRIQIIIITIVLLFTATACKKEESAIVCENCNTSTVTDSQFCPNCGNSFNENTTTDTDESTTVDNSETSDSSSQQTSEDTDKTTIQDSHAHNYSSATCTSPQTCSCGATYGSALDHYWNSATCTSAKKCTRCGTTNGGALGHNWGNATCTSPAKCSRCGTTTSGALGHSWTNATCTSPKKCSRCSTTSGSASGHSYTSKITEPTCTAKGYTTFTCSSCGDSYKDNHVNASHNYQNYKCTSCGAVDKTHAYEYLIEWVKANGEPNGDHIGITEYVGNGTIQTITYNSTGDYLYVSCFSDGNTPNDDSDDNFCLIDLSSASKKYDYFCTYGNLCESSGVITASAYTDNSPLPCDRYTGPSNHRSWFLELSRLSVNVNILFLNDFINQCIPGISITDLGFTSF